MKESNESKQNQMAIEKQGEKKKQLCRSLVKRKIERRD
jgi:hypothetical protein